MYKIVCFEFFIDNSFNLSYSRYNNLIRVKLYKSLTFINNKHKKVGIRTLQRLFSISTAKPKQGGVLNRHFCDDYYFYDLIKYFKNKMESHYTIKNTILYKFDKKGKLIELVNLKREECLYFY